MKLKRGGGALAVGLAVMCLAPGGAAAKRHGFVIGPSRAMEAGFSGSKGFHFSLSAGKGDVSLSVSGHHATTQYSVPGHVSTKRLRARFGHLGRVSLRFRSARKPHFVSEPEGNCRGGGEMVQAGTFVGRIDFTGEMGYTAVHLGRVRGFVKRTMKQVCKESSGKAGGGSSNVTFLEATQQEKGVFFNALRFGSRPAAPDNVVFSAAVFGGSPRGLTIFRSIGESGRRGSFEMTKSHGKVVSATVEPPAPFTGSATYERSPASSSENWVGSLAVEFPGLGQVSLAGPGFCAETTTLADCEEEGSSWIAISAKASGS